MEENSVKEKRKRALVLSGGSVKGAFEAGAIQRILEKGFIPDVVYGISVGSLNGAFLANEAGKPGFDGQKDWPEVGRALTDFWKKNITGPEKIFKKRRITRLVWDILTHKFNGLVNTAPLMNLIDSFDQLKNSKHEFKVGCTNVTNGGIKYFDQTETDFINCVKASGAIPIVMPAIYIGGNQKKFYFDGGLRDVAPLKIAYDEGAEEIVCILCQAKNLGTIEINHRNLISLAERVSDIMLNEILNNDIEWANYACQQSFIHQSTNFGPYKEMTISNKPVVIRPDKAITIELETFDEKDISEMIELGYKAAYVCGPWTRKVVTFP